MQFPIPALLGLAYGISEAGLAFLKRSRDDSVDADDSTLRILWVTIVASVTLGILATTWIPAAAMRSAALPAFVSGCVLFGLGLTLRWYSIAYLGRFFTV